MNTFPDAEQFFRKGQQLVENEKWLKAIEAYESATALDSGHWKAHFGCALARQRLQEHAAAIQDIDMVLSLFPDLPEAFYTRAVSNNAVGDHEAALHDCDAVLRLRSDDVDAQYLRAVSLKQLRYAAEAIAALDLLLTQLPQHVPARYCRATLLYASGEFATAITDLDAYLAAVPRDYSALLLRGLAAKYDQRLPEALEFLSRAIEIDPNNGSTYCRRAMIYQELGFADKAAADLETGKALL